MKPIRILLTLFASVIAPAVNSSPQNVPHVPQIMAMPADPGTFRVRNWRSVTVGYLNTIFSDRLNSPLLPAVRWPTAPGNAPFLPSYLGGNGPEAINYLAAIVSGRLVGLHMSHFQGHNLISYMPLYLNNKAGVFANNPNSDVPTSFWYELLPNILAFQIYALGSVTRTQTAVQRRVADQWCRACQILTPVGKHTPNFNYTGFDFATMTPQYNGKWREPDGAAGVAWLEYMAWMQYHQVKYLNCAIGCIHFLETRPPNANPLYEMLLPYGAITAARLNAEVGTHFNVLRLVNWCFTPGDAGGARQGWGVLTEPAGKMSMAGLVGSSTDTHGYAFTMNTFEWAGALTPLARYDSSYASLVGRWILNLASNARLFYSKSLPSANQDCYAWCSHYDPHSVLPYEGLRLHPRGNSNGPSPFGTGDALGGGGPSNLCLYGGSHVGILAAIVHRTNVRKILRLNLLGTDYYRGKAYPTSLYFNPYTVAKWVTVVVGDGRHSLYNTVLHRFVARDLRGSVKVRLQPQQAIVLVTTPNNGHVKVTGRRLTVNGVVVDWRYANPS